MIVQKIAYLPRRTNEPICTKFGKAGRLADLITHYNFFGNRLTGFDSVRIEFYHFPISRHSPLTQCWRYSAACDKMTKRGIRVKNCVSTHKLHDTKSGHI